VYYFKGAVQSKTSFPVKKRILPHYVEITLEMMKIMINYDRAFRKKMPGVFGPRHDIIIRSDDSEQ
jgi:hypothetical protein